RHGEPLPLPAIHALLHGHGYMIDRADATKALADSLGYETRQGRAVRVSHGVYAAAAPDEAVDPFPTCANPLGPPAPPAPTDQPSPPEVDPWMNHDPTSWPGAFGFESAAEPLRYRPSGAEQPDSRTS